jgi:hypothetical protein
LRRASVGKQRARLDVGGNAAPLPELDDGEAFNEWNHAMIKRSIILASAALLVTAGAASAQRQMPPDNGPAPKVHGQPRGATTGTPNHPASSSNPQAATGTTGQAPHEVPENGGAPMKKVPAR